MKRDPVQEVGSMAWALVKPMVAMFAGLLMLVMLLLLCQEVGMLLDYWRSERVYAASAEQIDPANEGRLVRVTGPLQAEAPLSAGNLGTWTGVIEVQQWNTVAYADDIRLGAWQVRDLYPGRIWPLGLFVIDTPGVERLEIGDKRVSLLRSGAVATLVGRQRGQVLDMSDPVACAHLGTAPVKYTRHIDVGGGDFTLRSFEGIAVFSFILYFFCSAVLGFIIRRSWLRGMAAGAVLLLLVVLFLVILCLVLCC
ncbi:MAG: hypothetical protein IKY91_10220 [Akkermansia sp.]|nr:hypothetical protein [Akkermansia sp.]